MRITAFAMLLVVAGSAHAQPANRPTPSGKTSPATAPVKDEAAQRKLDDAAAAGQIGGRKTRTHRSPVEEGHA